MQRKDLRRRGLRWLTLGPDGQAFVLMQHVILVRWKCKDCSLTFTQYPEFRPSL